MVAAAREALAPYRQRHQPVESYLYATPACWRNHHDTFEDGNSGEEACRDCTVDDGGPRKVCVHCRDEDGSPIDWPCDDARDCYTTEELEHQ